MPCSPKVNSISVVTPGMSLSSFLTPSSFNSTSKSASNQDGVLVEIESGLPVTVGGVEKMCQVQEEHHNGGYLRRLRRGRGAPVRDEQLSARPRRAVDQRRSRGRLALRASGVERVRRPAGRRRDGRRGRRDRGRRQGGRLAAGDPPPGQERDRKHRRLPLQPAMAYRSRSSQGRARRRRRAGGSRRPGRGPQRPGPPDRPFTPHLAEEGWARLGGKACMACRRLADYDPDLAAENELVLPVQVNGKRRGEIRVAVRAGTGRGGQASPWPTRTCTGAWKALPCARSLWSRTASSTSWRDEHQRPAVWTVACTLASGVSPARELRRLHPALCRRGRRAQLAAIQVAPTQRPRRISAREYAGERPGHDPDQRRDYRLSRTVYQRDARAVGHHHYQRGAAATKWTSSTTYALREYATNAEVTRGTFSVNVTYDASSAALRLPVGQLDGERRVAEQAAERMRIDLATYFASPGPRRRSRPSSRADRHLFRPPAGPVVQSPREQARERCEPQATGDVFGPTRYGQTTPPETAEPFSPRRGPNNPTRRRTPTASKPAGGNRGSETAVILSKRPDIERFLAAPRQGRAALIFGRDRGQVRERADALAAKATERPDDPFDSRHAPRATSTATPRACRRAVGPVDDGRPSAGAPAARQTRPADRAAAEALKAHLEGDLNPDAFFLIEAGALGRDSTLRKAAEAGTGRGGRHPLLRGRGRRRRPHGARGPGQGPGGPDRRSAGAAPWTGCRASGAWRARRSSGWPSTSARAAARSPIRRSGGLPGGRAGSLAGGRRDRRLRRPPGPRPGRPAARRAEGEGDRRRCGHGPTSGACAAPVTLVKAGAGCRRPPRLQACSGRTSASCCARRAPGRCR